MPGRAPAQLNVYVEQHVEQRLGFRVIGSEDRQHALAVRGNVEATAYSRVAQARFRPDARFLSFE